jgi:tetratricopeptide (TPR) repeat protein
VYYELGWEYFEKAASFGMKRRNPPLPTEEAKYYASLIWKDDPRLPQLLGDMANNQHNGQFENAFKEYLQAKAVENLDEAVARRGTHIVPNLFLSRGLFFADKGDMHSARKEFAAALDEASQLPASDARQEASIAAHYNLAVAEAGLGQLKEALSWIRLAEREQDKLGRTVVPELTASREKLESKMPTIDHD